MNNDVLIISSVVKNVPQSIFNLKFLVLEKVCIHDKINIYKIGLEHDGRAFCLYEIVDDNFLCEKCFKYDNNRNGKIVFEVFYRCYRYYCKKCVDKIATG